MILLLGGREATAACSPDPYAHETAEQRDARMAWWREARFGMFIHWGVYAVPAGTYAGRWMKINGEAIYGTTASPFAKLTWGRCTKTVRPDGATLYLHVFDWPSDGVLLLPGLRGEVKQARLLDGGDRLTTKTTREGMVVRLPSGPADPIATVIKVDIDGELRIGKVLPRPAADGTLTLPAQLADIHNPGYGNHAQVEDKYGEPNIGHWLDARAWVEWSFRLDRAGTYALGASIASPAAGSRLRFSVGDQERRATLGATGGYDAFETVSIGRFTFDEPGVHTLAVKPVRDGWQPVNLRSVVLRPVAK
jgi:alpha-L-fucosidase